MTAHVTHAIAQHAILPVFVIMAVDSVLPVGGELAGGVIAGSRVTLFGLGVAEGGPAYAVMVITGTLGHLAGSLFGWIVGRRGGRELIERHGRWLHLGPERFARAERWFDRFGGWAVCLGPLTPLCAPSSRSRPGRWAAQWVATRS